MKRIPRILLGLTLLCCLSAAAWGCPTCNPVSDQRVRWIMAAMIAFPFLLVAVAGAAIWYVRSGKRGK